MFLVKNFIFQRDGSVSTKSSYFILDLIVIEYIVYWIFFNINIWKLIFKILFNLDFEPFIHIFFRMIYSKSIKLEKS